MVRDPNLGAKDLTSFSNLGEGFGAKGVCLSLISAPYKQILLGRVPKDDLR